MAVVVKRRCQLRLTKGENDTDGGTRGQRRTDDRKDV